MKSNNNTNPAYTQLRQGLATMIGAGNTNRQDGGGAACFNATNEIGSSIAKK